MRTIKFRGKREFVNEWLVGSLLAVADEYFIFPEEASHSYNTYRVNTETVGQFTGLTDKDGMEIYEGDIVNITDGDDILVGHGVVEWLDNWGLWYVDGEGHANNGLFDINCSDYLEVIGNIHDNPELLKNND